MQVPPDGQTRVRRAGRPGDGQSTRRGRPSEGGERPQGERPSQGMRPPEGGERPQGRQFQLTDEMINRIMSGMAQSDPEKAKELEKLRKSDPEKFKAELMQNMRNRMRQGGSGTRQRQGGAGSGPNP